MNCPKCGFNHADPPKCRACGAEITEEQYSTDLMPVPVVEEKAEPTEEVSTRKTKKK